MEKEEEEEENGMRKRSKRERDVKRCHLSLQEGLEKRGKEGRVKVNKEMAGEER